MTQLAKPASEADRSKQKQGGGTKTEDPQQAGLACGQHGTATCTLGQKVVLGTR